jgi:hypothetical protein
MRARSSRLESASAGSDEKMAGVMGLTNDGMPLIDALRTAIASAGEHMRNVHAGAHMQTQLLGEILHDVRAYDTDRATQSAHSDRTHRLLADLSDQARSLLPR